MPCYGDIGYVTQKAISLYPIGKRTACRDAANYNKLSESQHEHHKEAGKGEVEKGTSRERHVHAYVHVGIFSAF